jgi:hypothetical protein
MERKETNERANGRSSALAGISKNLVVVEAAKAVGIFRAVNVGPVEHLRREYTEINDELLCFKPGSLVLRARSLRKALAEIPLEEKWRGEAPNHVTTEGANLALDTFLAGSAYTVVGPYMGLISSVSYTTTAIGDTAAQINGTNGWKEAGSSTNFPLYTTPRKTCAWSAAAAKSKALSAALSFPIITTGGTVKGCFIIFGTGALSTIADVNGKLWSAGVFTGGDKVVDVSDTLNVSYSSSL